MRLIRQTGFLLLVASIVACHDSTGPATIAARFDLTDIDGRALPTYPAATPGLTPTILSGIVILNDDGTAEIDEHRTDWDGTDRLFSSPYTYKITDGKITFSFSCPPNADCISPPEGTLFGSRLSLVMGHVNTDPITYNYRLITE